VHIGIVNLTSGGLSGGYRKYLLELVPRLRAHPDVSAVTVFNPASLPGSQSAPDPDIRVWRAGASALRRELRSVSPDIVFFPTARSIDCGALPSLVMVRNMEPLAVPFAGNPWGVRARNLARRLAARRSCLRASRLIAVSNYVAEFLVSQWRIPASRVAVVYHGVEQSVADPPLDPVPAPLAELDPQQPWIFTAGSIRPARGLTDLLRAVPLVPEAAGPFTVVIAGKPDRGVERHYARLRDLAARQRRARVLWSGQLDANAMRWCLHHASSTVLTTRAEACPNIALEALAYGASLLAADNPPLPEFLLDTARYYRSGQPESLAAELTSLLSLDPQSRREVAERARQRARSFTWDATVAQTVRELHTALRNEARAIAS
jgi:glycosyltransferase involved in cell wall biosynthesis